MTAPDGFHPVVESPLLIARGARSGGGSGGLRVSAGWIAGEGLVVVVEGAGRPTRLQAYGSEVAVAHAFNDEVRRAERSGLTSRPEPVELSADAFSRALAALGGLDV